MSDINYKTMDKYRDGKLVEEGFKPQDPDNAAGKYWWMHEGQALAQAVIASLNFMKRHQGNKTEQLIANTRMYGNSSAFNFIGPALSRSASGTVNSQSSRLSFNLCAAVIDTMVSKIAKNKVIPVFLTQGGVWGMQKKAENLSKFLDGMFYQEKVHYKSVDAFRDAGVWGSGMVHVYPDFDAGVVRCERVLRHGFYVDAMESLTAPPRQMHWENIVDRDSLKAMFQDDEEALAKIERAMPVGSQDMGGAGSAADLLAVVESWHLPSSKNAEDGVHSMVLGDDALFKDEYDKDYFPFPTVHYIKNLQGHWGQGACERLEKLQQEVNRGMITIQRSHWLMAGPKIAVEMTSKIPTQHLTNDIASIIHYSEKPPIYLTPPIIQPDVYQWVDSCIAKGFQQEGVSQLAASSLKPEGVDSGAAMRTYDQIGDDRLLYIQQCMEEFTLEIGRQMIDCVKELAAHKKRVKVLFPQATFVESIDWSDVKMKEDEYVLKAYPTSSLPEEPAGRLAYVQEQAQAGYISPRAARKLMANPDIEMSDKLANAPMNLIESILEEMLEEDGKYQPPEPYYDLALAKQTALSYYNYAALNKCPEERLELLRRFMAQVDDLTGIANPQPQPGQAPQAAPEPTPTSNLIPNVAGGQAA